MHHSLRVLTEGKKTLLYKECSLEFKVYLTFKLYLNNLILKKMFASGFSNMTPKLSAFVE